ncbi:MAG TPA: nitrate- and nitrite sensing domain-containing protein [Stackebrandtia sp.]|uniref:sensor histidine kinase n=1 Tax=Stackebrandtia sp. TaxID=2023065 RepID=UPI002D553FB3|nr:nitrate- and nitrite sensing domain-containing protein [Stackebrandtia sp.]HZE37172.1 nitrate- and nitrite sensing domain-containing protein [Stackebrandtia sp.]
MRNLVACNQSAGELIYNLQAERTVAVDLLTGGDSSTVKNQYDDQIAKTDKAISKYRQSRKKLTDTSATTTAILDRVDTDLKGLDSVRERVAVSGKPASSTAFAYRITIAELLSYRESVPQVAVSAAADKIRASTLLSRTIEYQSTETEIVLRALDQGKLSEANYQAITAANTGAIDSTLNFDSVAPAKWQSWLEQSQLGSKMVDAKSLEDEALRTPPGSDMKVDKSKWISAMNHRADQLQKVQHKIDSQVVHDVKVLRDQQYTLTGVQIAGVVIAVLIALVMATWLGGPVVRGLRRLRDSAHHVATKSLPEAVAQLDDHNVLGEQTPDEFARKSTPPVKIRGKDELADVGRAFNEVNQEAIRVAAHQALLRLHIGAMFVRLARRGHSLSGRLTAVLDEAERNEQDPDRLERLFALDHLVTLFGRTNDSLLVLGGASPAKARASNETVANVLTAAQSQIEQYQRIQIGAVDDGISLKAATVDDVAKLLAELLDNATRYSEHSVNVTARLLADRMVIQINDRGMGIPEDRIAYLNKRLATQTPLDLEAIQAMGLTVVGNLAALHGIGVELRKAATGGTLAEVSLPVSILEERRDPRAIGSGPDDGRSSRRAPLFTRTRRKREGASVEAAPSKPDRRRPGPNTHHGSRQQLVPESDIPKGSRFSTDGAAGMPILRFDWGTGRAETNSPNEHHTAVQPAISDRPERPRTMGFNHESPAEAGWRAAEQATQAIDDIPEDGLPRREPMAQLVPGGVAPPVPESVASQAMPTYRDPQSVGATYAAYVRARGRNRSQPPN